MKTLLKRNLALLLVLATLLSLCPLNVLAADDTALVPEAVELPDEAAPADYAASTDSDSCGAALTWALEADGTLVISGTGKMDAFEDGAQPWADRRDEITSVVVEAGVTTIGKYAFSGCVNLTDVTLPNTVSSLGEYAFSGCTGLTDFSIPDSVTNLPKTPDGIYADTYFCSVFADCTSLRSVEIGANLKTLRTGTFADSPELTVATFRGSSTVIEEYAVGFHEASAGYTANGDFRLIGFTDSTAETYAEANGFDFTALDSLNETGSCGEGLTWTLRDGTLTISGEGSMTAYSSCKQVPWYPFRSQITAIVVEEGVASISDYAFFDCTAVTAELPATVETIGKQAFGVISAVYDSEGNLMSCGALSEVTLPDSITGIAEDAFFCNTEATAYYCTENSVGHNFAVNAGMAVSQHYLDEGVITTAPTTTTTGRKVYTCRVCGTEEAVTLCVNGLRQVNGIWGYYLNGELQTGFTGLYKHTNGIWYYVQNGLINWGYTGLVYHSGSWWYVQAGRLDSTYRGLAYYNGSWWYVNTGKVYFYYTGLYKHTNGIWYYIESGRINWSYSGLIYHSGSWWYIQSGRLDSAYAGLAYYNGSWWYVSSGKVNFSYTGLAYYNSSYWYVRNGKVDFSYTGTVDYNGSTVSVKAGRVV